MSLAASVARADPDLLIRRLDGSDIPSGAVDAIATQLTHDAQVPGLGLAILQGGAIVYCKTFGFRDKENALPLTTESIMTAASLTKPAFAFAVMKLVDDGRLDLDEPVIDYLPKPLPEYPAYADLANDTRYRKITARMLLDHTSGLPNWRWLEDDKRLHIHFAPGQRFAYSGEGIVLLQRVIEAIVQQSLREFMHERVFAPLGMGRSSMVWEPRFEADHALPYDEAGHPIELARRSRADAAGSMQTTLADYARFLAATLETQWLSPASRTQMLSPQIRIHTLHEFPTLATATTTRNASIRLSYGLGWGLYFTPYGKAYFKEGHDDGWRHYAVMFEGLQMGLLIMTNSSNGEGIYQELLTRILGNDYTPIEWEGFAPGKRRSKAHP